MEINILNNLPRESEKYPGNDIDILHNYALRFKVTVSKRKLFLDL